LTDGVIGGNNWLGGGYLGWLDPGYMIEDQGVDSAVPQPQLTFDFGNTQVVDSVTIHYMVDYPTNTLRANLHAPDSMTIMFSTSGPAGTFGGNLIETGFNDSPESDGNPGGGQPRSLTMDLGGVQANAIRLDFRTDAEWMFLSEVVFNTLVEVTNPPPAITNTLISATAALDTAAGWNAAAGPGLLTDGVIGGNEWINSGQYLGWSDPGYVANPPDSGTDSGVPQPQLTFNLGESFFVDTVTIHYIVDYPAGTLRANLRAPDSMAVTLSTTGPGGSFAGNLVAANFDDSPENNAATGVGQARSLTLELGGAPANAIRLDFRTDGEWLFLSEVVFRGKAVTNVPTRIAATAILDTAPGWNPSAGAGLLTDGTIGGNNWISSGYLGWSDPGYIATPPDSGTDSGVPQPQLTFDLGRKHFVDSITLHYMVDYPAGTLRANLHAPDSMTVMFSASGPTGPFGGNLVEAAFDDGPEENAIAGWGQARTLTMDLGNTAANALRLDFRTDAEWLFLSEVIIKGTAVPEARSVASVGAGKITISFETLPGLWYRVVRTDTLPAVDWTEVLPGWQQGTGLPMQVVDEINAPGRPRGFYQVEISPVQP
jgi:hypothetical protein